MRLNVTFSDELIDKINIVSSRWGCSKSDLISVIVGQYFDSFDKYKFDNNCHEVIEKLQSAKK